MCLAAPLYVDLLDLSFPRQNKIIEIYCELPNRFGRNIQVVPADLDLSALCAALLSSDTVGDAELHPDVSRLLRLCNNLNKMSGEISLDAFEDRVGSRDDWRVATSE